LEEVKVEETMVVMGPIEEQWRNAAPNERDEGSRNREQNDNGYYNQKYKAS
jgi:hypothetical protein